MKTKKYRVEINLFSTGFPSARKRVVKYRGDKFRAVQFARRVSEHGIVFVEDKMTLVFPARRIASVFVSQVEA